MRFAFVRKIWLLDFGNFFIKEGKRMKKIRMIGLDLDGTLLTSRKQLTTYTVEVLREAIRQGIVVLVATGRPYSGIPQELQEFPGMRYALTSNGARILDTQTGQVLIERLLPLQSAKKALEIIEKYDTLQEVYFDGVGYADSGKLAQIGRYHHNPYMWEYVLKTRKAVPDIQEVIAAENRDMDKLQALFADMEERAKAWEELSAMKEIVLVGSLGYNIEINAAGVDKGKGLITLGEYLGIRREEIMACGDGDNDVMMLKETGFGVAMANAEEQVKAVADYITDTNDADGVAKAIERFVL